MDWIKGQHGQRSVFCATLATAEAVIRHLCKQERKLPTPVPRRLSRTHCLLGRTIPGRWVPISVLQPLRIPSVTRLECRTSIVVLRWTDELLCGGYKRVSRLEMPMDRWTGGQVSAEWSRCPGSMTRRSRDSMAPLRPAQQVGCPRGRKSVRRALRYQAGLQCSAFEWTVVNNFWTLLRFIQCCEASRDKVWRSHHEWKSGMKQQ